VAVLENDPPAVVANLRDQLESCSLLALAQRYLVGNLLFFFRQPLDGAHGVAARSYDEEEGSRRTLVFLEHAPQVPSRSLSEPGPEALLDVDVECAAHLLGLEEATDHQLLELREPIDCLVGLREGS